MRNITTDQRVLSWSQTQPTYAIIKLQELILQKLDKNILFLDMKIFVNS